MKIGTEGLIAVEGLKAKHNNPSALRLIIDSQLSAVSLQYL
jgi:hypothetical protein